MKRGNEALLVLIIVVGMVMVLVGAAQASSHQQPLQVAQTVRDQIAQGQFDPYQLRVHVKNGVVTLSGEVVSFEQAARMSAIAERVAGVRRVENQLQIRTAPPNHVLQDQVRLALGRVPGLESAGIEVRAESGIVTVQGSLPTFRDVDRVLANTLMVPGVSEVRSEIKVAGAPYPIENFKIR